MPATPPLDHVPLPESGLTLALLAERIAHERETRIRDDQMREAARKLQAREYARRLDVLNHAHEAAVEAQARTVPRETFDGYVETSKEALEKALSALESDMAQRRGEVDRRIKALEDRDIAEIARASSRGGVQSFLAPNLSSVVAIVATLVALYLALQGR